MRRGRTKEAIQWHEIIRGYVHTIIKTNHICCSMHAQRNRPTGQKAAAGQALSPCHYVTDAEAEAPAAVGTGSSHRSCLR